MFYCAPSSRIIIAFTLIFWSVPYAKRLHRSSSKTISKSGRVLGELSSLKSAPCLSAIESRSSILAIQGDRVDIVVDQ